MKLNPFAKVAFLAVVSAVAFVSVNGAGWGPFGRAATPTYEIKNIGVGNANSCTPIKLAPGTVSFIEGINTAATAGIAIELFDVASNSASALTLGGTPSPKLILGIPPSYYSVQSSTAGTGSVNSITFPNPIAFANGLCVSAVGTVEGVGTVSAAVNVAYDQ